MSRIARKQFECSGASIEEALRQALEHMGTAEELTALITTVYYQCDALKAAALAYIGDVEAKRLRDRDGD